MPEEAKPDFTPDILKDGGRISVVFAPSQDKPGQIDGALFLHYGYGGTYRVKHLDTTGPSIPQVMRTILEDIE